MAYTGETYLIDCSQGGLTGNDNPDVVATHMMLHPSRNINLHNGGREKRGGTSHINSSAVTGTTPKCLGGFDFENRAGTQSRVTAWDTGSVVVDETTEILGSHGTGNYYNFVQANDKLFICDATHNPYVWTGSGNAAEIAHPATDFGTYPVRQMLLHGYGNSERMWALNQVGVYASLTTDFEDFSDGTVINIPIDTGDGDGLQGMIEFGDRLIVFGKRKSYIIDDTSTDTGNWGYTSAIWDGGAASWRLIVRTPNDIVCMMDDGEIYSVTTAEQYGDYKYGSMTRPAWMHKWIAQHVSLTHINDFHAVFDPNLRAIKFFLVRSGHTEVDSALVYFLDRGAEQAWMLHDNQSYDSGYSASASWLHKKSVGNRKVYTGDYSGYVWELETANANDNSNAYYGGFKTPSMPFDNGKSLLSRINKAYNLVNAIITPEGNYNLSYNWWIDGVSQTSGTISLAGAGAMLDAFTLDTDSLADVELIDSSDRLGGIGKRIQFEFYNSSKDQSFFVSQLLIDFKRKGAKQQA